jgi:hypothetical protein
MSVHAPTLEHRLTVGSITDEPIKLMLKGRSADVLYCDPPWDDGHMKSFARVASRARTVPVIPIPWTTFMHGLVDIIRDHVRGWVFVEMGNLHVEQTRGYLLDVLDEVHRHEIFYGSPRRPAALLVAHTEDPTLPRRWRMSEAASNGGLRQVKSIVASVGRPGQVLLDPCCGLGLSAKAAIASGMAFYGNELDPSRARVTRELLEGA